MLLSLAIFIPAIVLVMWRPRPFNEATAAALGAVALIIAGVVTPLQTWQVCLSNLNVLLFFLGLMVISTVADKAGIFEWLAHKVLFLAGGHGVLLLALLFALGTVITAFFSNDATALILTPIVFTLVSRLKLNALPYVFACAFTANTASMFLPVSNPVNLLAVDKFGLTLGSYLSHLLLPSILAIGVLFLLFLLVFRKTLTISSSESLYPGTVATDRFFICVSLGLFLTAAGYILVSLNGLPAAYPALGGALWMLACSFFFRRVKARQIYQGVSWSIFLFIIALAVLVKGLENGGVIQC
jgi:arsenical pump membrane protein